MQRDLHKWLQSHDLCIPITQPRRDLRNGYVVAELLSRYIPDRSVAAQRYQQHQKQLQKMMMNTNKSEQQKTDSPGLVTSNSSGGGTSTGQTPTGGMHLAPSQQQQNAAPPQAAAPDAYLHSMLISFDSSGCSLKARMENWHKIKRLLVPTRQGGEWPHPAGQAGHPVLNAALSMPAGHGAAGPKADANSASGGGKSTAAAAGRPTDALMDAVCLGEEGAGQQFLEELYTYITGKKLPPSTAAVMAAATASQHHKQAAHPHSARGGGSKGGEADQQLSTGSSHVRGIDAQGGYNGFMRKTASTKLREINTDSRALHTKLHKGVYNGKVYTAAPATPKTAPDSGRAGFLPPIGGEETNSSTPTSVLTAGGGPAGYAQEDALAKNNMMTRGSKMNGSAVAGFLIDEKVTKMTNEGILLRHELEERAFKQHHPGQYYPLPHTKEGFLKESQAAVEVAEEEEAKKKRLQKQKGLRSMRAGVGLGSDGGENGESERSGERERDEKKKKKRKLLHISGSSTTSAQHSHRERRPESPGSKQRASSPSQQQQEHMIDVIEPNQPMSPGRQHRARQLLANMGSQAAQQQQQEGGAGGGVCEYMHEMQEVERNAETIDLVSGRDPGETLKHVAVAARNAVLNAVEQEKEKDLQHHHQPQEGGMTADDHHQSRTEDMCASMLGIQKLHEERRARQRRELQHRALMEQEAAGRAEDGGDEGEEAGESPRRDPQSPGASSASRQRRRRLLFGDYSQPRQQHQQHGTTNAAGGDDAVENSSLLNNNKKIESLDDIMRYAMLTEVPQQQQHDADGNGAANESSSSSGGLSVRQELWKWVKNEHRRAAIKHDTEPPTTQLLLRRVLQFLEKTSLSKITDLSTQTTANGIPGAFDAFMNIVAATSSSFSASGYQSFGTQQNQPRPILVDFSDENVEKEETAAAAAGRKNPQDSIIDHDDESVLFQQFRDDGTLLAEDDDENNNNNHDEYDGDQDDGLVDQFTAEEEHGSHHQAGYGRKKRPSLVLTRSGLRSLLPLVERIWHCVLEYGTTHLTSSSSVTTAAAAASSHQSQQQQQQNNIIPDLLPLIQMLVSHVIPLTDRILNPAASFPSLVFMDENETHRGHHGSQEDREDSICSLLVHCSNVHLQGLLQLLKHLVVVYNSSSNLSQHTTNNRRRSTVGGAGAMATMTMTTTSRGHHSDQLLIEVLLPHLAPVLHTAAVATAAAVRTTGSPCSSPSSSPRRASVGPRHGKLRQQQQATPAQKLERLIFSTVEQDSSSLMQILQTMTHEKDEKNDKQQVQNTTEESMSDVLSAVVDIIMAAITTTPNSLTLTNQQHARSPESSPHTVTKNQTKLAVGVLLTSMILAARYGLLVAKEDSSSSSSSSNNGGRLAKINPLVLSTVLFGSSTAQQSSSSSSSCSTATVGTDMQSVMLTFLQNLYENDSSSTTSSSTSPSLRGGRMRASTQGNNNHNNNKRAMISGGGGGGVETMSLTELLRWLPSRPSYVTAILDALQQQYVQQQPQQNEENIVFSAIQSAIAQAVPLLL